MSVTERGSSITMTATADAVTGPRRIRSVQIVGTGMTAGHRFTITNTNGDTLYDHYVVGANENVELHPGAPKWQSGLILTTNATGTWTVIIGT